MKRMWSEEELKEMIEQGGGGSEKVTASDIDSGEATSGQVLKADGNGGAEWGDASGGGKLYKHSIYAYSGTSKSIYIEIINNSETQFQTTSQIELYLRGLNSGGSYYYAPCSGLYDNTSIIFALYSVSNSLYCKYHKYDSTNGTIIESGGQISSFTISQDVVNQIN